MTITLISSDTCIKCKQLEGFLPDFCKEHLFEFKHINAEDYEGEITSVPTIIIDGGEHSGVYDMDEFLSIMNNLWK